MLRANQCEPTKKNEQLLHAHYVVTAMREFATSLSTFQGERGFVSQLVPTWYEFTASSMRGAENDECRQGPDQDTDNVRCDILRYNVRIPS